MSYRRVAQLRTPADLRAYLSEIGVELPFDETMLSGDDSPLAQPYTVHGRTVGNRFAVLPMEGWDGTPNGRPTDLVKRRWAHFGQSGAKLVWGGEAVAVRHEGRANPNQLRIGTDTVDDLARLRELLVTAHREHHESVDDLVVGLQLTHSGRWSRPDENGEHRPRIAYRHPVLDQRVGASDSDLLADDELAELRNDFVHAALLGASGCLAVPAPAELVCAATALVWAGGQCFPRMALSLMQATPCDSVGAA